MSRQFATNVTTIYDIFCPVPFLPSPFGFRKIFQKNSRRLELSISKNTPHGRCRQGPGSFDPRFPAGLPFPVPEIRDSGNIFQRFSRDFPGVFLGNPRTDPGVWATPIGQKMGFQESLRTKTRKMQMTGLRIITCLRCGPIVSKKAASQLMAHQITTLKTEPP